MAFYEDSNKIKFLNNQLIRICKNWFYLTILNNNKVRVNEMQNQKAEHHSSHVKIADFTPVSNGTSDDFSSDETCLNLFQKILD